MKKLTVLLLLLTLGGVAGASPIDDKMRDFTKALKAADIDKNPESSMMAARLEPLLDSTSQMPGGMASLEAAVKQLMATASSPEVQKAGQALLDELTAQRKAQLDAMNAKINAVVIRIPEILAKAQKPADLDAILADLQAVLPQNRAYGYDTDSQAQVEQVNSAYQFVAQWQDYLSALDGGNTQEALNSLRSLLNSRSSVTLVPRSEILARISTLDSRAKNTPGAASSPYPQQPQTPDISPILESVKTVDDIAPALKQLKALPNIQNETNQLAQLASIYADAKNGLTITLDYNPPGYYGNAPLPGFEHIRSIVLLYLLPRFLGSAAPAPNPDETIRDYIDRVTIAAENTNNLPLLQRILQAQLRIARVQSTPSGAHSYLAGLNQEMAGQYRFAVNSYQSALRDPDDFTSAKVIGDRLAAIEKDHKSDFDDGMKDVVKPPTYANPAYYPMMNPYARYGMPGAINPAMPSVPINPAPLVSAPATNSAPVVVSPTPKPSVK